MIGQMAIAIALPGFNDLGPTVTPVFLLMAQVTHHLNAVKISKKSIEWKIFARTSLSVYFTFEVEKRMKSILPAYVNGGRSLAGPSSNFDLYALLSI